MPNPTAKENAVSAFNAQMNQLDQAIRAGNIIEVQAVAVKVRETAVAALASAEAEDAVAAAAKRTAADKTAAAAHSPERRTIEDLNMRTDPTPLGTHPVGHPMSVADEKAAQDAQDKQTKADDARDKAAADKAKADAAKHR